MEVVVVVVVVVEVEVVMEVETTRKHALRPLSPITQTLDAAVRATLQLDPSAMSIATQNTCGLMAYITNTRPYTARAPDPGRASRPIVVRLHLLSCLKN